MLLPCLRCVFIQQDVEHDIELHRRLYMVAVSQIRAAGIRHKERDPFVINHWQTFVC